MEKHRIEKQAIPPPITSDAAGPRPLSPFRRWAAFIGKVWTVLLVMSVFDDFGYLDFLKSKNHDPHTGIDPLCPQVSPYSLPAASNVTFPSEDQLAEFLSGAVKVDTTVGDNWPTVQEDPERWAHVFDPFRAYLSSTLPRVHAPDSPIKLELINGHGLLYTWQGQRGDLKPVVFMAHQDVVPVEPDTIDQWTHPPFSGYIDRELGLVWGRGASDTKSSLVSILASFDALLAAGHVPERTLVASFGFDEESSGTQGGAALAAFLVERYGQDGAAMIVDEGGTVLRADDAEGGVGIPVAAPAVGEKGYLDTRITVLSPGGHSSAPHKHTSIGYLAQLVTAIEANPHPPVLRDDNPALQFLQCTRNAPATSRRLARALEGLPRRSAKRKVLSLLDEEQTFSFQTTQAVDLISGGIKVNAMPETASFVVNHRIETGSSVQDVRDWIYQVVKPVAEQNGLHVEPYTGNPETNTTKSFWDTKRRVIISDAFNSALEPAPNTPLGSSSPWTLLSGAIRAVWHNKDGSPILVAPDLMGGNTDTKSYWDLSKHIFRFSPTSILPFPIKGAGSGIHTVNEAEMIDTLTQSVRFYTLLMQAASVEDL